MNIEDLIDRFQNGDRIALSRVISVVENGGARSVEVIGRIYPKIGGAHRIGITGPPGAGKSTVVNRLALEIRKSGLKVAIIAVDPSSPFTGGALLGDRLRMKDVALDEGVFIRSLATRGSLGGLSYATRAVADAMDAFGFDVIIIETIGVGQSELDVMETADSIIVVLVPESGDAIQAMKAGIMEIGDIFVINKSDREGADSVARSVEFILGLKTRGPREWNPPVLKTIADRGGGIVELWDCLQRRIAYMKENDLVTERLKSRVSSEIKSLIYSSVRCLAEKELSLESRIPAWVEMIMDKKTTPYLVADEVIGNIRIWEEDARP